MYVIAIILYIMIGNVIYVDVILHMLHVILSSLNWLWKRVMKLEISGSSLYERQDSYINVDFYVISFYGSLVLLLYVFAFHIFFLVEILA